MGILRVALLVVFIVVALLLVLLVLIQNEEGDSLGGIFAGGSSSAFGSRSGNVLTRATSILGGLFLVISFGLALINRGGASDAGVERVGAEARQQAAESNRNWWQEPETPAAAEPPILEAPAPEAAAPETPDEPAPESEG